MATTGRSPTMAMPAAAVTACCSAMPTSKYRSGKRCLEREQPGGPRHRRGDGDQPLVVLGCLHDGLGEGLRVPGGHGLRRAQLRVEHRGVVQVLLVVVLGGRVALALLGEDVHDDGSLELHGVAQRASMASMSWPSMGPTYRTPSDSKNAGGWSELPHPGLHGLEAALGRGGPRPGCLTRPLRA
jgi:hypothetical protein